MSAVVIAYAFRGPSRSGNGGYSAGLLAASAHPENAAVEVTLRQPPPLDTPMHIQDGELRDAEGQTIATSRRVELDDDPIDPVPFDQAKAAEAHYGGLAGHPFPSCFGCGTDRQEGDGLCLRPGPLGDGRTACTWVPHHAFAEGDGPSVPVVWAALDCTGGWTADVTGRPCVLGRMTAQVDALPATGERCVVMGRLLGEDGRKLHTASTLYDETGRVLGRARHVWITVDPSAFE
jgi:hypothetical protein